MFPERSVSVKADFVPSEEVNGDDERSFVIMGELAGFSLERSAIYQLAVEAEFLLKFILFPLLGEPARCHDEDFLYNPPEQEFLDEEPGHDGLSGPCVVGQEKANSRQREQVPIYGFHLVRQGIDDARVYRKQRIKLVSDFDTFGFCPEEEDLRLAVE